MSRHSNETLMAFIEENNRMPRSNMRKEWALYTWFLRNQKWCLKHPKIKAFYMKSKELKYNIECLTNFIEENGRMPRSRIKEESKLYVWFSKNREECLKSPIVEWAYKKQVKRKDKKSKYNIISLIRFIEENGRMPRYKSKEENGLYQWFYKNKEECLEISIIEKKHKGLPDEIKKTDREIQELLKFIEENDRMPKASVKKENILYQWFLKNKEKCLKISIIKKAHKKTSRQSHNIDVLIDFIQKNDRMPKSNLKKENSLHQWFLRNKEKCLKNSIIKKANEKTRKQNHYKIDTLIAFIEENNRMPKSSIKKENNLYWWFIRYKETCLENIVVKKAYEKTKRQKNNIEALINFIVENDRMPSGCIKGEWHLYKWFSRNEEECLKNPIIKNIKNKK